MHKKYQNLCVPSSLALLMCILHSHLAISFMYMPSLWSFWIILHFGYFLPKELIFADPVKSRRAIYFTNIYFFYPWESSSSWILAGKCWKFHSACICQEYIVCHDLLTFCSDYRLWNLNTYIFLHGLVFIYNSDTLHLFHTNFNHLM